MNTYFLQQLESYSKYQGSPNANIDGNDDNNRRITNRTRSEEDEYDDTELRDSDEGDNETVDGIFSPVKDTPKTSGRFIRNKL